jgi:hypothetical protein
MTIAPEQPPHDRRQIRVFAERAVAMHAVRDLEGAAPGQPGRLGLGVARLRRRRIRNPGSLLSCS